MFLPDSPFHSMGGAPLATPLASGPRNWGQLESAAKKKKDRRRVAKGDISFHCSLANDGTFLQDLRPLLYVLYALCIAGDGCRFPPAGGRFQRVQEDRPARGERTV